MIDPETGVLVVQTGVKRVSRKSAAMIREAMAQGYPVQFQDRHQWRHFQIRRSV